MHHQSWEVAKLYPEAEILKVGFEPKLGRVKVWTPLWGISQGKSKMFQGTVWAGLTGRVAACDDDFT
jgi:hypothetical protein